MTSKTYTIIVTEDDIRDMIAGGMRNKYNETIYGKDVRLEISLSPEAPSTFMGISGKIRAVIQGALKDG